MQTAERAVTLPVTIEQIASAIKQMSALERDELLRMVPELRHEAGQNLSGQTTSTRSYSFKKARVVLKNLNGNLSEAVVAERDEQG
jgi:hypothetical protein